MATFGFRFVVFFCIFLCASIHILIQQMANVYCRSPRECGLTAASGLGHLDLGLGHSLSDWLTAYSQVTPEIVIQISRRQVDVCPNHMSWDAHQFASSCRCVGVMLFFPKDKSTCVQCSGNLTVRYRGTWKTGQEPGERHWSFFFF